MSLLDRAFLCVIIKIKTIMKKSSKDIKKQYYVSNREFYEELVDYLNLCKECEKNGDPIPIIPNEIGIKIIKIAHKLSYKPNFINYSFKNEMISDAIYNCTKYLRKFNPEKSTNPFSYFSQICWNAFVKRIKIEKKVSETKEKLSNHSNILNNYTNYNRRNAKNNL